MKKHKIFNKMNIIITLVASIITIMGISVFDIINKFYFNPRNNQIEIEEKLSELYKEIQVLDLQLQYHSLEDKYMIINGVGENIDPSELLNYRPLISKIEELHGYYYFLDLILLMKEHGYNVENKEIDVLTDWFLRMNYDEQADILSNMFAEYKTLTYRLANNYIYHADVTKYPDHNEYSNVTAEATEIEERKVKVFICYEIGNETEPLGAIKKNNENKRLLFPKTEE